jgi:hypothetical protein
VTFASVTLPLVSTVAIRATVPWMRFSNASAGYTGSTCFVFFGVLPRMASAIALAPGRPVCAEPSGAATIAIIRAADAETSETPRLAARDRHWMAADRGIIDLLASERRDRA